MRRGRLAIRLIVIGENETCPTITSDRVRFTNPIFDNANLNRFDDSRFHSDSKSIKIS